MNLKTEVNKIINEYGKFEKLFEDNNGYDLDDYDSHYQIWLTNMAKELAEAIQSDLVDLCEDNEAMIESIQEYFSEYDI